MGEVHFHQFFTHYSYSHYVYINRDKYLYKGLSENNIYNHINNNTYRSARHLERLILDVYKVATEAFIKQNNILSTDEYRNLLKVRQNELNKISVDILDKVKQYKEFLQSTDFYKKECSPMISDENSEIYLLKHTLI